MPTHRLRLALLVVVYGIVAGLLVRLTACAPPPARFRDDADLNRQLVGKTTEEVRALLGEPFAVIEQADNVQFPLVWKYERIYANPVTKKQVVLLLFFRDDKVVCAGYRDAN